MSDKNHATSPHKKSCNRSTQKIMQPLRKKSMQFSTQKNRVTFPHNNMKPQKKNHATFPTKKSCQLFTKNITQPPKNSHNLFTAKIMQSFKKITQPLHKKVMLPLLTKTYATSSHKKSCNLTTQKIMQPPKNHTTSPQKNYASSTNITRIAKRCPENITLIDKGFKLHFPKLLKKLKKEKKKKKVA